MQKAAGHVFKERWVWVSTRWRCRFMSRSLRGLLVCSRHISAWWRNRDQNPDLKPSGRFSWDSSEVQVLLWSVILSSAVSGARIRLLFVSTMFPLWIISSRMMWTRSRLNMIWRCGVTEQTESHSQRRNSWKHGSKRFIKDTSSSLCGNKHQGSEQASHNNTTSPCPTRPLTTRLKYLSRTSTKLWTSS